MKLAVKRTLATITAFGLAFVASFSFLGLGCGQSCHADLNYGVVLKVVDEVSDTAICDAEVTATRVGTNETSKVYPSGSSNDCWYSGLPEQYGKFSVTVSQPGYSSKTVEGTVARGEGTDGCSEPIAWKETVRLVPVQD